jgi:hypothetical protein
MKKYAFSTDFDTISENIGIPKERYELLFEKAKEVAYRAIMYDKFITEKSQAMEIYLNEIQPTNEVEAFFAGVIYQDVFSQTEKMAGQLAELMGVNG